MKKWKLPIFCVMIAVCLMINYGGMLLAEYLNLPFWLDSLGTILCAYMTGPVIGAMVGVTTNMIFHVVQNSGWEYSLINLLIGVIAGLASRRKKMETLFDTLTIGGLIAISTLIAAVPLNIFLNNGSTGNTWGNAVIGFFRELGLTEVLCLIAGQLYVEMLDKIVVMVLAYIVIRLIRAIYIRGEKKKNDQPEGEKLTDGKTRHTVATLSLLTVTALILTSAVSVRGENENQINFNDYVQTVYTSHNGLPCGEANDIAQTMDGILWIGTYAGLYRYNGREFRWMDNLESVRNVNSLYVDEEGRLWIGTNDNGLSIMINDQIVNVIDQNSGLPNNSVSSIVRSHDGYYYVGTKGSMQVLSLNYGLRKLNTLSEVKYAVSMSADEYGRVAAVTDGGTLYLLEKGHILSSRQITDGESSFRSCEFTQDGRLLAATTKNEIYVFNVRNEFFEEQETILETGSLENIKDMICLDNGELLITTDSGIGVFSTEGRFSTITTGEFNNSIDKALIDYQGNMWFTSSRLGLLRLAHSEFRDLYSTLNMESHVVNAVIKWQDTEKKGSTGEEYREICYIGTDEGLDAVDLHNMKKVSNRLTQMLEGGRVRNMMVDRDNHLWICNAKKGLLEIEPGEEGEIFLYNASNGATDNKPRIVTQISDGTVVLGGDKGLSFIRNHQIVQQIDRSIRILTILEMPDGKLLAGTDGGGILVLEYRKKDTDEGKSVTSDIATDSGDEIKSGAEEESAYEWQIIRTLTRENGISSEVILRMVPDADAEGSVFLVTSNALCYMDADGKIRLLSNFPYFNNYDIWFKGKNTLFVMSSAGIYIVDRDEVLSGSREISYELLDSRRGLNSSLTANSWTYFDQRTGELFLACDTGVYVINSSDYSTATHAYRMSVPTIRLDGTSQRVERSETIRIGRGISKLELYPEVVNYTIQDPYVGYMLEGFDQNWIIVPQNSLGTITYTNLPAGEYTFRLAVFDNDQKDILAERVYKLSKEKELYDSPWFIVYLLTIPMFTVAWVTWLLVKRRNQRMERELAEANRQVEMAKQTVGAIAKAVDAKDVRTGGHSSRVALYSRQIAKAYGLDERQCREIEWAAQLHDIGKIAIPDAILNKDSRLTDDEYAKMKTHTTYGAEILKDFTLVDHVTEGAEFHHERPDGKGYPKGLKADEIPLSAQIIGVADAFDAMTASRVYRKQMDFGYVLGELEKGRGTQFAPEFVDILLNLIRTNVINLNEIYGIKPADNSQTETKPDVSAPGKEA